MKKKIISGILALLTGVMLIGCGANTKTTTENTKDTKDDKLKITVSIYPLKEFTEEIAGDKAEVTCLVPNNVEPHEYDPKAQDLEGLTKSDAFIYNGFGMESWIDKVNDVIKDKNIPVVDSSTGVESRKEEDAIDPHSWLSLKNAEIQSENIKNTLVKLDEKNKDYYEGNYSKFKGELESLYGEYKPKFEALNKKNFITGHAAFGYLCRDFGLTQKSVENLFAEGEPTPKQLEDLVSFCKESNIKTVFSESLASPKVSETLAKEVGAKVVPILTLESKEDDKSYLESMRYNLDEIYGCLKDE
ncbi:metal ABC transporter solute-binding protein, Zn/Mn family [Clostridium beijerinckii]|uniref:Zinc transport system substrate-binding protein n=1 Tax=Clostridium beijerinckii TaxID=1520 RepID=A0A9Q5CHA3_CLOBE|nr:zinc ABC transporter substrate-binding protein [Clostridium beijerinckii]AQS07527.1 high-affinity zinc uptake system binding-protein ZnuA precursor [Clostridium beijerinckii]MBA2884409.1 zinc transport system substrate-binding protein [Clostridium beijerinckii]MBA2898221.1 zinc transport system substrate-binding protein [Clostridium beijerinckii]MBA2912724.1 zinc transport system substrate-binding protein [Clostridium beijerinckii]MBA9012837.1 zinc transport system substrate-binding protein